jgi:hypothetical protein
MSEELLENELLKRKAATQSLIAFTEYTFERYRNAPHHKKIAEALERSRLILGCGPSAHGHGYYHLPSDTIDTLDFTFMDELVKSLELARVELPPASAS